MPKHLYRTLEYGPSDDEHPPGSPTRWPEIPHEALERKELGEAVQSAVASLPQKYREVVTLRDIKQLSIKETALVPRLSSQNVKIRLLRARLRMRDVLALRLYLSRAKKLGKNVEQGKEDSMPRQVAMDHKIREPL